jgi:hypothetical protein
LIGFPTLDFGNQTIAHRFVNSKCLRLYLKYFFS